MNQDISLNLTLAMGGKELLKDTTLTITKGEKYGIIGANGIGKSTLLNYINKKLNKELEKIRDIYMVNQEVPSSSDTIYHKVLESNQKVLEKLKRIDELENSDESDENSDELNKLYNELEELDYSRQESLIKKILHGLGFSQDEINQPVSNFSGGWRMRVALACALYRTPDLLLLDEPTNHLDLEANIWLINYLKTYKKSIMVISHDIEFLDEVCTNIIHLENQKLNYYKGNYYRYRRQYDKMIQEKTKQYDLIEKKIKEMKKSNKQKKDIEEYMKKNPLPVLPFYKKLHIDFGIVNEATNSNLITLENISFSYGDKIILDNVDFGVNYKSRIALVGKNGSGKSTLMKIITGDLIPTKGEIKKDDHVRVSYFNQHTFEYLPEDKTPVEYLLEKYSHKEELNEQIIRGYLGKNGLEGPKHKEPIKNLSGGQKVRVSLVELQLKDPHILVFDEPTNHLDLHTIEALKDGINMFDGAVIITTHNIDLIEDTNCTVMELNNHKCTKIEFADYCDKILQSVEIL